MKGPLNIKSDYILKSFKKSRKRETDVLVVESVFQNARCVS